MPAVRLFPRFTAVVAVASLAIVLAGCSGSSSATKTAAPSSSPSSVSAECVKSGPVSDSVKVTGDFGAAPNVTINSPLKLTTTERTVVTPGTGPKAAPGNIVNVSFTLYDGTTGKTITSTGYGAGRTSAITVDASKVITGFAKTLNCAQSGTRVVGVIPSSEGVSSSQASQLGIAAKDVIVIVADVVGLVATKASGQAQPPPAGLPTVTLASDGAPTVKIPSGYAAPATTQIATLIKGTGAVVGATDTVTIQYQGTLLRTDKIFDQTWGKSPYTGPVSGFVPGFTKAIVGQTVGSQVLAVITSTDGYGSGGNSGAGITGTDTMIFVVDVLAAEPAAAG